MDDADLQRVPFTTGERGSYTFRGVRLGDYLLQFDRTEGQLVTVDRAEQTIEVAIARGVEVHGRVVDGQGQVGVAAAGVWLNHGTAVEDRVLVASTDAAGRFVVRDVPAGRYLSAERAGSLPSRYAPIAAAAGADQKVELELRLDQPASSVQFEVVDATGAPIANALVQVGDDPPRAAGAGELHRPAPAVAWPHRPGRPGHLRGGADGLATPVFARAARTCAVEHTLDGSPLAAPVRLVLTRGGSIRGTLDEGPNPPPLVVARAHGERASPSTPLWCLPSCVTRPAASMPCPGSRRAAPRCGCAPATTWPNAPSKCATATRSTGRRGSPPTACCTAGFDGLAPAVASTLRIELRATARRPLTATVDADGGFHFAKLPGRDSNSWCCHANRPPTSCCCAVTRCAAATRCN